MKPYIESIIVGFSIVAIPVMTAILAVMTH